MNELCTTLSLLRLTHFRLLCFYVEMNQLEAHLIAALGEIDSKVLKIAIELSNLWEEGKDDKTI